MKIDVNMKLNLTPLTEPTAPTALISVSHKEGIVKFARQLVDMGWDLMASGGTAKKISEAGLPVSDVASIVGGDPILGHRVVTLSREVAAGLLAKDNSEDRAELESLGIPWVDLVCVDLYPLREEILRPGATEESVLELTDIGGPTLLSEAAKGRRIIISNPEDRQPILDWLRAGRPNEQETLRSMGARADDVVAQYRALGAEFHSGKGHHATFGQRVQVCRYGENAWQEPAALYESNAEPDPLDLDRFQVVAGATPSYNNFVDVDRLLQTVTHIVAAIDVNNIMDGPLVAVAVKHGNSCGAAIGSDPAEVLRKMVIGDRRAIFGGLVMTNFEIDESLAEVLRNYESGGSRRLLDGVIAPAFTEGSTQVLRRRGGKCRFLANPALSDLDRHSLDTSQLMRQVRGGYLLQPNYTFVLELERAVREFGNASDKESDLLLAWAIGSTSNSNTVTLVRDSCLIGNGVGQHDRVGCCELAIKRATDAGHKIKGAVAYSDSFFAFPDAPEALANAGVSAILTSSGSIRDNETRRVCRERGVALYMIPDKIGRGFFGH